jgi:hypothetical protein
MLQPLGFWCTIEEKEPAMPVNTSPTTDALAHTLASLRGLTPDEAIALALRAELERVAPNQRAASAEEPAVEEIMTRIASLGRWRGLTGAQLTDELYDSEGLPR